MLIYLLIFIFVTVTPEIKLEKLKSSYKADYNYYCIQKNGSVLKNIADSHFLFTGTLLGTGIYQHIKYKNMPLLEKLPQLLIPISTGYLGERFIEFLGKREYENAKKNSTENYQILKHCFEILEKKEKMAEITQTDFLEQYDDNYKKTTNETYDKINKTIFKREENFLYPKRIKEEIAKKEEKAEKKKKLRELAKEKHEEQVKAKELEKKELHAEALKKAHIETEKAELERKKIETELAEKNIIKIFQFEKYNKEKKVRAFYGWEEYVEEKAKEVNDKINRKEAIRGNTVLYGPPGCGKTSYVENVTKAIATQLEKDVIFYNIKNADLKTKTKTKNSAPGHINQLFNQVYEKAENGPVVLFFDEFDGISTKRESIDKEKQNQIDHQNNDVTAILLQKIEEASEEENILIFAATNLIANMDDALIRPGRFDHKIHIGKPNVDMRKNIITNLFVKASEKEASLLLHLTSNQTSAEAADTVKKYLNYKEKSENIEEEEKNIESFTLQTFMAQNNRSHKEIDTKSITAWINEAIKENSIQALIEEEQKNPEVVSIEAIRDQEIYPSIKCNIPDIVSKENINASKEEEILEALQNLAHLVELKGLPRRFNEIDESFKLLFKISEEIKNKQDNTDEQLFKIQDTQNKTNQQLTELITGANKFLEEYKKQKNEIKIIQDNTIATNILLEGMQKTLNNISILLAQLKLETLTKAIAEELKLLMENILIDIRALIEEAFLENHKVIIEKINSLQTAVNMINTFEEIKTLNGKIEKICNETQQTLVAKALENKVLLNIVFIKTEEKEKFFLEKTKAINWLGEKEKEQIKKFILLITTAYDYNEYVNFLDKIFSGQNEITIESKSLETEKKYNEELSNACRVFKNLEPLREKILTNNISFSTNNLPQPTSADDVWQHLLNSGNYYEQKSLKDNLLKVKDFISKKWNSTEEFENFNVLIKNCMYLSDHDQKEILNEHEYVSLIRNNLSKIDKDKINEIISDVALNDLKNEIGYSFYCVNKAANRLKFRIKFNLDWFIKNIKQ